MKDQQDSLAERTKLEEESAQKLAKMRHDRLEADRVETEHAIREAEQERVNSQCIQLHLERIETLEQQLEGKDLEIKQILADAKQTEDWLVGQMATLQKRISTMWH